MVYVSTVFFGGYDFLCDFLFDLFFSALCDDVGIDISDEADFVAERFFIFANIVSCSSFEGMDGVDAEVDEKRYEFWDAAVAVPEEVHVVAVA